MQLIKKILVPIIKILISALLVVFIIAKLGLRDITSHFIGANLWWLVIAIIAFTLSNLLGALQWHLLMKARGIEIPLARVISYYYVGLFFNNFLIGYVGGDAIRIYDVARASENSSDAISTVFFDRLLGFAMMTTLALAAGLVWRNIFHSKTVILIILIIFAGWIISFIVLFNERFAERIRWLFQFFFSRRVKDKLRAIYSSMNSFKHEKKLLLNVLAISLIVQSLRILVHVFAALSIGIHIHIKYFFIFVPVIALLSSLPISIGGIGVREGSAVALFSQTNAFPSVAIVAMEFISYLIGLLATIPGGLIFILRPEKMRPNHSNSF